MLFAAICFFDISYISALFQKYIPFDWKNSVNIINLKRLLKAAIVIAETPTSWESVVFKNSKAKLIIKTNTSHPFGAQRHHHPLVNWYLWPFSLVSKRVIRSLHTEIRSVTHTHTIVHIIKTFNRNWRRGYIIRGYYITLFLRNFFLSEIKLKSD